MNFDSAYLEVIQIVGDATSLSQIHSSYDNVTGTLEHVGNSSSLGVSEEFILATVMFKAKAVTDGEQVSFNSGYRDTVVALGESHNLVSGLTGAEMTVTL